MQVKGSHQIVPFGDNLMRLFDSNTGDTIVTATRSEGGTWTVHAEVGEPPPDDVDVPNRGDAIQTMIKTALTALGVSDQPGGGYATIVPHGLAQTP